MRLLGDVAGFIGLAFFFGILAWEYVAQRRQDRELEPMQRFHRARRGLARSCARSVERAPSAHADRSPTP